ncbi:MAG: hypothetical protein ACI909_001220 [Planctomycetota bacterium]|jgi:hypothetical protein
MTLENLLRIKQLHKESPSAIILYWIPAPRLKHSRASFAGMTDTKGLE